MSLLLPFTKQFPSYRSLGENGIFPQSPSKIVDLCNDAVDLACCLSRLSRFLGGVKKLLTCYYLSPDEFHRYSRKIVCLVEVSRRTLSAVNILPFSSFCRSSPFRLHKTGYIDLLKMLYDHRHHVDSALQDRLNRLLQPLVYSLSGAQVGAAGMAKERSNAASPEGRPGRLATATTQRPPKRPHHKLVANSECDSTLMPPPDKFSGPCKIDQSAGETDRRGGQQLWDPEIFLAAPIRRRRRRNSCNEDNDQENNLANAELESLQKPFKLRPLSRHFGIYCTGKITMHRQSERAGRPGGTGSVIKE
ncbi:hypothetical protein P691DRAFT_809573 [Macrolepiota fuliginosa MF-IS2]|uniref:Uncharacterized protein n=1 Tax=Macrolepiota fuliginosa MF-IS2 TaxID=1400762 RepID=A0A9P5XG17_9AGAR|nr:hypothetical protein P691DRAFT_809573 [Macrolepiota fuliginosa MF-IS2]